MKDYKEMAQSVFERRDKYNWERKMVMNRIKSCLIGAVAACVCLVAVGMWHNNAATSAIPPTAEEQVNKVDMPDYGDYPITESTIGHTDVMDTTIWMSADEVLKLAGNDSQMGVYVPMLVAYEGSIYSMTGEECNGSNRYALSEKKVTLRKNFSYPAYQVKDISDCVAIIINGKLTIYRKLFEVNAVIDGTPYSVVHPMGLGNEYTYGEIIQKNGDITVYQAIKEQSGDNLESEYIINILPLLKREIPNFFGGDENYGDAWWVAVPCSGG